MSSCSMRSSGCTSSSSRSTRARQSGGQLLPPLCTPLWHVTVVPVLPQQFFAILTACPGCYAHR
jgi:hypothetical protein